MSRFCKIIACIVLLHFTTAMAYATGKLSLINGKTNQSMDGMVALFKVKHGELVNVAAYELHGTKQFSFAVEENAGTLYYLLVNARELKDEKATTRQIAYIPLYVKTGERIDIDVQLANKPSLQLKDYSIQKPSNENIWLIGWTKNSAPIVAPWQLHRTGVDYKTYYSHYQQLLPQLTSYAKQIKVQGNPGFNNTLKAMAEAQIKFSPLFMYDIQKEWQAEEGAKIMKPMLDATWKKLSSFCNAAILNAGMGKQMMMLYNHWYRQSKGAGQIPNGTIGKINMLKEVVNQICSDTLKGHYIANSMRGISKISGSDFEMQTTSLKPYLKLDYMMAAFDQQLQELSGNKTSITNQQGIIVNASLPTAGAYTKPANHSIIQGTLSNFSIAGEVVLLQVQNGKGIELCKQRFTRDDRQFSLAVFIEKPAFYYLQCGGITFRIYLKPAEHLAVNIFSQTNNTIGKTHYSYEVLSGSKENRQLQEWFTLSLPITVHGVSNRIIGNDTTSQSTYAYQYESVQAKVPAFIENVSSGNIVFKQLMQKAIQVDMEFSPLLFLVYQTDKVRYNIPTSFPGYKNVPEFYTRFIEPAKFCSPDVLQCREGADFINLYSKLRLAIQQQKTGKTIPENEQLKWMLEGICNDTIRSFVMEQQLDNTEILNLSEFNTYFLPAGKYATTASSKKKYNEAFALFATDTLFIGKPAINISLPDSNGNIVNLNSFKGKVIFIDTWATWCGPCKEQLPHLKELEEAYKNESDLIFVGISIDKVKDHAKWKKMIRTEQLPGLQLFDDYGKQFRTPMLIEGIPRFLLIDKKGNWVEVRCPRPDQKAKIKSYIDKALGQE